jgi:hypothetical protein
MRATSTGFELTFTQPVDPQSATNPRSYTLDSYTYLYRPDYGSDEIQSQSLSIDRVDLSEDRRQVRLTVRPLRQYFVHELNAAGVRNAADQPLLHSQAYYTLNRIPK